MSVKSSQVAYGVRVKLNDNFEEKCLGDRYLKDEKVLFIRDPKPYNDIKGEYVWVTGGSLINSGYVYLDQIDLEFPIPETPLYPLYQDEQSDEKKAMEWFDGLDTRSQALLQAPLLGKGSWSAVYDWIKNISPKD